MAKPTVASFRHALLYIESATAGTYTKFCGLESLTITRNKETTDSNIPDCDNPDAASSLERDVVSLDWEFSAEGFLTKEHVERWNAIVAGAVSVPIRFYIKGFGTGVGTPDLMYAGKAHFSDEISGERGGKIRLSMTGIGDGDLTITSVAAI